MEAAAILLGSLILLAVLIYYNLVRLFCFLNLLGLFLSTLILALVLFYSIPGAETKPGHPLFYLPGLISLVCLGICGAVVADGGKQDTAGARLPLSRSWPWLISGAVVHSVGVALCLITIYVKDSSWRSESLQASLYMLFAATALSSILLSKVTGTSKIERWFSLIVAQSVANVPNIICLIYIYAVPDEIPRPGLAAWASLCVLPSAALIWWLNHNRPGAEPKNTVVENS